MALERQFGPCPKNRIQRTLKWPTSKGASGITINDIDLLLKEFLEVANPIEKDFSTYSWMSAPVRAFVSVTFSPAS